MRKLELVPTQDRKNIYHSAVLGLAALSVAGFAAAATPLYNFAFDNTDGGGAVSKVVADQQGALYGTTYGGGLFGTGTVFKLTPPAKGETNWTYTVLHSFCEQLQPCSDGANPVAGVIFAKQPNGIVALFGTTKYGGTDNNGTIFRLLPPARGGTAWTYDVLYRFAGGSDGSDPLGSLIADPTGPFALYGTTNGGGTGDCDGGCGTVFALTPNRNASDAWTETVLYSFLGGVAGDGQYPKAGPSLDQTGALYGTTYEGGGFGYGTVFRLTPPTRDWIFWSQTVLHHFAGGADGAYPRAGVLVDTHQGIYGTTAYGGANCDNLEGCGTVFKVTPPDQQIPMWTNTTLHSFELNPTDNGEYPLGDLIFGNDGAIYGTTQYGGTPNGDRGGPCGFFYNCGTIFRLTGAKADWKFELIYKFCTDFGCPVGAYPTAGLTTYQGALYGTTSSDGDGAACDCGAIFRLDYPSVQRPGKGKGRRD